MRAAKLLPGRRRGKRQRAAQPVLSPYDVHPFPTIIGAPTQVLSPGGIAPNRTKPNNVVQGRAGYACASSSEEIA